MKDIVNDFDDYLITNSKRAFRYKSIDLEEFMNYINNDYEDDLKEEGISLEIINNCSSLALNMDVSKIRRVFSNIISNSVRYLRDDGKIIINCNDLGDYIEFVIEDNGKWVPEENLVKIFEPLYTTDPSRKISGLGLSICKDIIEAHNGTIRAYNNKLGGLSIEFTISKNIRNEELHK
jgi:signal transduction histidine kinase